MQPVRCRGNPFRRRKPRCAPEVVWPLKTRARLRLAVDLGPPPSHADKQKAPIVEKFRRFAFEGVADKLQHPSKDKQSRGIDPQPMDENGRQKKGDRNKNGGNTQRVASPVYGMMVTGLIFCDPLLVAAIA